MKYERILLAELEKRSEWSEICDLLKKNSLGNAYLIGGAVSRTLTCALYKNGENSCDYDFVVDTVLEKPVLLDGWKISYTKFGNPTFTKGVISVDIFPLADLQYIKEHELESTIENFLEGTPFTIQSLAYDMQKCILIGERGLDALRRRVFAVNNKEAAESLAKRKGTTILEQLEKKAKTMGFSVDNSQYEKK